MIFEETALPGAYLIRPEPMADARGFFARTWDQTDFAARGLDARPLQSSISYNTRRGTLRGLHLQADPHGETKLVRCTAGAIADVLVDLRPGSPTFGRHVMIELSQDNRLALYVPIGIAHGFQTLKDGSEVLYQMGGSPHVPGHARGYRHDDPAFGITWPLPVSSISERDLTWPDFQPAAERDSSC